MLHFQSLEAAAILSNELAQETDNLVMHFKCLEEEKVSLESKVHMNFIEENVCN